MAAFVLVVFVALASVRIGRAINARLRVEVQSWERIALVSLLLAPLVLLLPLALIDMGLFLVVVLPIGFATLLATGWKVVGRALLLPAVGFCYLRLWLNMLDGMVALASGTASRTGEIANELPDRISDVLIFVGVGHSTLCHPLGGYWVARETSVLAVRDIEVRGAPPQVAREVQRVAREAVGASLVNVDAAAIEGSVRALQSGWLVRKVIARSRPSTSTMATTRRACTPLLSMMTSPRRTFEPGREQCSRWKRCGMALPVRRRQMREVGSRRRSSTSLLASATPRRFAAAVIYIRRCSMPT